MKICLINQLYEPYQKGGAGVVVKAIVKGLVAKGHEVFIITIKPFRGLSGFDIDVEQNNGLKIYRFCPLNLFSFINIDKKPAILRFFWHIFDVHNWHSARIVKRILKDEKPQVVMTHNLKGLGFNIPKVIKKLGIKHIHTLHDVQLSIPTGLVMKGNENDWKQKGWLTRQYEEVCLKKFNSPDIVVSPSRFLLNFYKQRGFFKNSKKFVLPNPINLDDFEPPPRDFDRVGFKFLFVGHIEWHKGPLFLVDVFKALGSEYFTKGVMLNILGQGSLLPRLKEMTRSTPQIIIRGPIWGEAYQRVFDEVDAVLVPSLCYENSPTVIYEALASGVPVIASRIGGVSELIDEGKTGFTFEAGDREDLTRLLKHVLENRADVQKMRSSCLAAAREHDISNYLDELLGYLRLSQEPKEK